jgi:hypothetical protein
MLVVPLKGDKIETKEGVTFTVTGVALFRERGPAVYVEHTPGVPSDAVYFFDINKLNDKVVEYVAGSKVLKSVGLIKRKFHLPQPNDTVTIKDSGSSIDLKVVGIKLHRRGELHKGLQVQVEEEDENARKYIRLNQIIDIQRDVGGDVFSRDAFLRYYAEYRGQQ